MTLLARTSWMVGVLLATWHAGASAQSTSLDVACGPASEELRDALTRELSTIGVDVHERAEELPRVTLSCTASGGMELRFDDGARVDTRTLAAGADANDQLLRAAEYCRAWLTIAAEPDRVPPERPDDLAETDRAGANEGPEAAGSSEDPTGEDPQADGSSSPGSDELGPPAPEAPPDPGAPESVGSDEGSTSLRASFEAATWFGSGDADATFSLQGNIALRLASTWQIRVGLGGQVAGGGVREELMTQLLRLGGDLSYHVVLGEGIAELAFGLGAAALRVWTQAVTFAFSMPPQEDSAWVSWLYVLAGASVVIYPPLLVYLQVRGGVLPERVIANSPTDPLPVLVGRAHFEASLGLEVAWVL